MTPQKTREQWLHLAAARLAAAFKKEGKPLPETYRISCGLAGGRIGGKRLGECWSDAASKDGCREIFISPEADDPVAVLAILVHELCHAALPFGVGHKRPFRTLATALGLTGRMTATTAGPELTERLNALVESIGPYPHASLMATERKKEGTRLIQLACPDCEYTVRTTQKWIDIGLPVCPCGTELTPAD